MRVELPVGARGSLKWIQRLSDRPELLATALSEAGVATQQLQWLAPKASEHWAEYRDASFLIKIGQPELPAALAKFWPDRGPQWDGLLKDGDTVYLVEAKAHAGELASSCQASSAASRGLIQSSCEQAKLAFGAAPAADWLNGYYQYANRLAHLHFLREQGVDAQLVFLYFTGDADMRGPASASEWLPVTSAVMKHLGFAERSRLDHVHSVYLDVRHLA